MARTHPAEGTAKGGAGLGPAPPTRATSGLPPPRAAENDPRGCSHHRATQERGSRRSPHVVNDGRVGARAACRTISNTLVAKGLEGEAIRESMGAIQRSPIACPPWPAAGRPVSSYWAQARAHCPLVRDRRRVVADLDESKRTLSERLLSTWLFAKAKEEDAKASADRAVLVVQSHESRRTQP